MADEFYPESFDFAMPQGTSAQREAARDMVRGVAFTPFDFFFGPADIMLMPPSMRVADLGPKEPLADTAISTTASGIEALGGSFPRPTGSVDETAGRILGSLALDPFVLAGAGSKLARFNRMPTKAPVTEFDRSMTAYGQRLEPPLVSELDAPTAPVSSGIAGEFGRVAKLKTPSTAQLEPPTSVLDPLEEARLPSVGAQGGVPLTKTNPVIAEADEVIAAPGYGIKDKLGGEVINYSPTLTSITELGVSQKGMPAAQLLNTINNRTGVSSEIRGTKFESILKDTPSGANREPRFSESDLVHLYEEHVPQTKVHIFSDNQKNFPSGLAENLDDPDASWSFIGTRPPQSTAQLMPQIMELQASQGVEDFGVATFSSTNSNVYLDNFVETPLTLKGISGHDYYGNIPGYYGHIRFQDFRTSDNRLVANVAEQQTNVLKELEAFNTDIKNKGLLSTIQERNATGDRVFLTGDVQMQLDEVKTAYEPIDYLRNSKPMVNRVLEDADAVTTAQANIDRTKLNHIDNALFKGREAHNIPPQKFGVDKLQFAFESNAGKELKRYTENRSELFIPSEYDMPPEMLASVEQKLSNFYGEPTTLKAFKQKIKNMGIGEYPSMASAKYSEFIAAGFPEDLINDFTFPSVIKNSRRDLYSALTPYELYQQPGLSKVADKIAGKIDLTNFDFVKMSDEVEKTVTKMSDQELIDVYRDIAEADQRVKKYVDENVLAEELGPGWRRFIAEKDDLNIISYFAAKLDKYTAASENTGWLGLRKKGLEKSTREDLEYVVRRALKDMLGARRQSIKNTEDLLVADEALEAAVNTVEKSRKTTSGYQAAEAEAAKVMNKVNENLQKYSPEQRAMLKALNKTRDITKRSAGTQGFIFKPPYNTEKEFVEYATRAFMAKRARDGNPVDSVNYPDARDIGSPSGRIGATVYSTDPVKAEKALGEAMKRYGPTYNTQVRKSIKALYDEIYGKDTVNRPDLLTAPPEVSTLAAPSQTIGAFPSVQVPMNEIRDILKTKPIRRAKGGPVDLRTGIGDLFRLYS